MLQQLDSSNQQIPTVLTTTHPATPAPVVQALTQQMQQVRPETTELQWSALKSNKDLATLIGIKSVKMLTWLGKTKSEHYSKLFIRKKGKSGKLRTLHNPDQLMRVAQYKLYNKVLEKLPIPDYIHAFERNKSIPQMAHKHVGKKVVISMDIKDFFHSIKQNKLYDMFIELGIGPIPARTISELCTFKAFVPQGAITSPKISNIVAAKTFGPPLYNYCEAHGLTLTIYADDITISSTDEKLDVNAVISFVTDVISLHGFRVNTRKTKVMFKHNRQYVCGVVVNEKTNLIRNERLKLRAMVHNVKVNGPEKEALKSQTTVDHFVNVLRGRLNWFSQLNIIQGKKLTQQLGEALLAHKVTVLEDPNLIKLGELEQKVAEPVVEKVEAKDRNLEEVMRESPLKSDIPF